MAFFVDVCAKHHQVVVLLNEVMAVGGCEAWPHLRH